MLFFFGPTFSGAYGAMEIHMNINIKLLAISLCIGTAISLSVAIQAHGAEQTAQQKIASTIIRFHVLANSNSHDDQDIKMQVKTSVLERAKPLLETATDINETRQLLQYNLDTILHTAKKITDHTISASIETMFFPEITYTNMTLPQGYYEAVVVRIGNGTGRNWWCVMFPMLCFVEGVAGKPTQNMEELMAKTLTEEEFNQVFNIRFKTLDILNNIH